MCKFLYIFFHHFSCSFCNFSCLVRTKNVENSILCTLSIINPLDKSISGHRIKDYRKPSHTNTEYIPPVDFHSQNNNNKKEINCY